MPHTHSRTGAPGCGFRGGSRAGRLGTASRGRSTSPLRHTSRRHKVKNKPVLASRHTGNPRHNCMEECMIQCNQSIARYRYGQQRKSNGHFPSLGVGAATRSPPMFVSVARQRSPFSPPLADTHTSCLRSWPSSGRTRTATCCTTIGADVGGGRHRAAWKTNLLLKTTKTLIENLDCASGMLQKRSRSFELAPFLCFCH